MKIRTLDQVNSHWRDGRHYSAMPGAVTVVDDDDTEAVAHMKHLVAVGLAEIVKDEPVKHAESKDTAAARAETKKTTTATKKAG